MSELMSIKIFKDKKEAESAKGLLAKKGIVANVSGNNSSGKSDMSLAMDGFNLLVKEEDFQKAQDALKVLEDNPEGEAEGESGG